MQIRRRSGSRCKLLTLSKVKFEDFWQGFLFIHTPSNFALIKEDVGGVAGYVEVLFFYRTIDVMALRAIASGPHTTKRRKDHKVYPYLLRELEIVRKNQVWSTDITYILMKDGFMYLTAVIDVHTRYVLHWSLSNTMDAEWCKNLIVEAFAKHGAPEILNTDQGSQYTSEVFSKYVLNAGIKLSMDGKGRATDNAFIERFWRTVKYENVYMNEYRNGIELYKGLEQFFHNYNNKRRHSSIDYN